MESLKEGIESQRVTIELSMTDQLNSFKLCER